MTSFTMIIIVITSIISFVAFSNRKLMDMLIFWPPAISMRNQYYRFITCGFIHADFIHLAFNMFTLYFFGTALENLYMGELGLQHYYFLILYFLALIVSNVPTYLKRRDDYNYRSLGASGAVSAVVFACILLRPWAEVGVYGIPMPALVYAILFMVYSIYMSRRGGDNVNHDAHLWGAFFGVVFTIAVDHSVLGTFINQLGHPRFRE
ncbi:rhomboid family intramembrane serine protease [Puia dinghuensis]|uniref:Rhomboid family intramembrane serine protease n=1 Tax=Puia dinghuensis TaxID=1792502 RepID=A0A8J2UBF1_9BACT|nr:rhomboid family intramembrane serine protease [Puia dinghuensis]GGA94245.1 rhomboid family intramembrane serine protease [Puia dinghuensis]